MNQNVRLERIPRDKVPAGSKVLTETEVVEHYFEMTQKWKPVSEIWPLKYGWIVLGATSCASNFFIMQQYRRRLKLTGGIMATLTFGAVLCPSMITSMSHVWYITRKIYLQDDCVACLHSRALTLQLGTALLYSLTVNPLLCFLKAQHLATYNVPGYRTPEQRRKMWQLYVKFTKRAKGTIYTHALINSFAASIITAGEIKSFFKMMQKLIQKEKEVIELKKKIAHVV